MIEFRDYQKDIIAKGTEMIHAKGFLYLAMEVRTGKTLTSLGICEQLNVDNVLFQEEGDVKYHRRLRYAMPKQLCVIRYQL
jgi:predicted helicase